MSTQRIVLSVALCLFLSNQVSLAAETNAVVCDAGSKCPTYDRSPDREAGNAAESVIIETGFGDEERNLVHMLRTWTVEVLVPGLP